MTKTKVQADYNQALKAILFTDAVEYTRLVVENEASTLELMRRCFRLFRVLATEHNGTLIKTTGDGAVLAFDSVLSSVQCAIDAQQQLARLNAHLPHQQRALFRIGIHLGEVVYEDGDIYGHTVNVAARVQVLAKPGRICLTEAVYGQLGQKLDYGYRNLGPMRLKNIAQPMTVYEVLETIDPRHNTSSASVVELTTFSGFLLATAHSGSININSEHARALVGYLALKDGAFEFRDRMVGLLWSQKPRSKSRTALGSCLRSVKHALKEWCPNLISDEGEILRLNTQELVVDVDKILDQLTNGLVSDDLVEGTIVPEQLLGGLENVDEAFTSWLQIARHNWRNKLVKLLESNLVELMEPSEVQARSAMALSMLDPTHEPACRYLMQCEALNGNAPGALRLYSELQQKLVEQFDIKPSEETKTLLSQIRNGEYRRAERSRQSPEQVMRLPRIQIKSFQFGRGSVDPSYLVAGLRSELIATLVRFREWVVLDDNTAQPDGDAFKEPQSAEAIDYLIQAVCEENHSRFSVVLTLCEVKSGRFLWSEKYKLALDGWEATKGDIVLQIAARLGIYISNGRIMSNAGTKDASLAVYDKWLKGEHLLSHWSPESELEARNLFQSVIKEMPEFALAYASLADVYNVAHLINLGIPRNSRAEAKAAELARRAVQIDPLNAKAQLTLAWSFTMANQYDLAELHFDMAMQLNPYDPTTLVSCAQGMAFVDRCDIAKTIVHQALQLTPLLSGYQWAYLATTRFLCGDPDGCVAASNMAGNAIVDVPLWKTAALQSLGKSDQVNQSCLEMLEALDNAWQGDPEAKSSAKVDWILEAYPLRSAKAQMKLKNAVGDALVRISVD